MDDPARLSANPDLNDRLSGVAAQASTALQNARLVDQITYQARHDELTGLDNRSQFRDGLASAIDHGAPARRPASGSSIWTWTASSRSTTASATTSAISC